MQKIDIVAQLSELMESHEIPFQVDNDWVVPHGQLPALRGTWYPREDSGVLDIEVLLDDERVINECFAGIGGDETGLEDALQNFCVNSFHVMTTAFWNYHDPEQVIVEQWKINEKIYTVYIGNFGTRGSDGVTPDIPLEMFTTLERAIKKETFTEKVTWFRFFFCNIGEHQTFESLKNNNEWTPGLDALKSLPWIASDGYYSVRNFIILKEKESGETTT